MSSLKKRIVSAALAIIITFISLCGRIYGIMNTSEIVSSQSHIRNKTLSEKRGNIYDRNGELLVNRKTHTAALLIPNNETALILKELRGDDFAESTVLKGFFTTVILEKNEDIKESESVKKLDIFERYSDSTALHLLGYLNEDDSGTCGIEKYFNDELRSCGGTLSVAYSADALGRMLTGEAVEIRDDNYYSQSGITLTIDRDFQIVVEQALENGNINKGAAVVLDAKTSAVLACASAPTYDRNNIQEYLDNESSPFLNRALSAFPVGSVFKAVTAAAALENSAELGTYNCTGSIDKNANIFHCNQTDGHGEIDFNTALALSCNPYFIELSTLVGGKNLLETAENLGFGTATDLGNGYLTDSGTLPTLKELNSDAATGNLGFGQGKLTATPLQIAACYAAIANGGIYNEPYIYQGKVDTNGALSPEAHESGTRVLNESTCKKISEALLLTATEGTGQGAYTSLFNSCTKTATAQSGQYDGNGKEIKFCWFVGYFPYDNPQYVICILKENGSSGGTDGAPVFKEISENIYICEQIRNQ